LLLLFPKQKKYKTIPLPTILKQQTKRVVLAGGPSTGKTTLINHLLSKGYHCEEEISRQVILEAQAKGIEQLFLTDPLLFSQKLLEGRFQQYKNAEIANTDILFYDRGMPDVTAYMDYVNEIYPHDFADIIHSNRYDLVFLLPPWQEIHVTDNERYESFEIGTIIYEYLKKGYKQFGYSVIEVPFGSVEERSDFVLKTIEKHF
jgi:predicted ATPase